MASGAEIAIGIDLGKTFSCVGVMKDNKVEIIVNEQGNRTTPSWVAFTESEDLIGEPAKGQAHRNPENTVFDVKHLIGRKFHDPGVQDDIKRWPFTIIEEEGQPLISVMSQGQLKTLSPSKVSAMILASLKNMAEQYLGKTVNDAVVSVPANFNNSQRQATKQAAEMAGLTVLRMINEPTAAAVAYSLGSEKVDGYILVFDFGGGTLDVTILEDILTRYDKDISGHKRSLSRLRACCEKAKKDLSFSVKTAVEVDALIDGEDYVLALSRSRFEDLNKKIFARAIELLERSVADTKLDKNQIDCIVLAGGSSRIPKVQKLLQESFQGKKLLETIHPDEAIASGSALLAHKLTTSSDGLEKSLVLMDVNPLSLGAGKSGGEMQIISKRNSTIPAKRTMSWQTINDNQTKMKLPIYEGERAMIRDCNYLGEIVLSELPPLPRGQAKVNLTFELDYNGILNVSATCRETGESNSLTLTYDKGHLSMEEISRMIEDSEKFSVQDQQFRERNTARKFLIDFAFKSKREVKDLDVNTEMKDEFIDKCNDVVHRYNNNQIYTAEDYGRVKEELKTMYDAVVNSRK